MGTLGRALWGVGGRKGGGEREGVGVGGEGELEWGPVGVGVGVELDQLEGEKKKVVKWPTLTLFT